MKVKNIIIIHDFDYVEGGESKVAIDTANLLSNDDKLNVYYFTAVTTGKNYLNSKVKKYCINQKECLKDKNKIRGCIKGIYNIEAKKELKKFLEKFSPEDTIIHVHGWTKSLSSSIFSVIFSTKFKMVMTLHDYFTVCPNGGLFNYKSGKVCKYNGNQCMCKIKNCDSRNYFYKIYRNIRFFVQNRIVKLSKRIKNVIYITNFSWNILKPYFKDEINSKLIYNPIEFEEQEKIDFRNNGYFLYVGRVSKEKGVDTFCKAIRESKVKGIVVGDGEQKEILEKKYSEINFVGWKDKKEVKEYMKKAKALIFCSEWYETAGLTTLEALTIGLPVIVHYNTASTEFIDNYKNGIIYKDFNELLYAIKNIESLNIISIDKKYGNNYTNEVKEYYEKIR